MKKYFFLLSFILAAYALHARVIRVNNNGVNCSNPLDCYTSLTAAYNASNPGDTIHLEPSATSYGNFTFAKPLVILGNGFFLGNSAANGNENLQYNTTATNCGNITVSSDADGIIIKGLYINILNTSGSNASNTLDNIIIERNRVINGTSVNWTKNLYMVGNYIGNTLNTGLNSTSGNNANYYIANNVLWSFGFNTTDNGVFENNILTGGSQPVSLEIYNSIVQNNISATSTTHTFGNCTVRNNLGAGTGGNSYGTLNGNVTSVVMANVFTDFANSSAAYSGDSRWLLKAGSPALGSGYNGVDCGIFGGNNPYALSGMPNIPSIYEFAAPATVSGDTISISISSKINN
mgnify:FL=1